MSGGVCPLWGWLVNRNVTSKFLTPSRAQAKITIIDCLPGSTSDQGRHSSTENDEVSHSAHSVTVAPEGKMTETPAQKRAIGRRALLRNTLITGAGVVALSAMSVPLADVAYAATDSYQPDWAWCSHCNAIFWATTSFVNQGVCPGNSGNAHVMGGTNYTAMYGWDTSGNPADPNSVGQQAGWAYCSWCKMLGWRNNSGVCPANSVYVMGELWTAGPHSYGSTNYAVPFGWSDNSFQNGWDYCSACAVLYWGDGWGKAAENCAATNFNGKHTPGSSTHYQFLFT